MSALLWRVIIAVICVVLIFAILPPFFRVVGFSVDGDIITIIRIAVVGIAVLYVLTKGNPIP